MDDLKIIELFLNRDESAITETANKYGKLCFSVAFAILENDEDCEECVNDMYLTLWKMIPQTIPDNFSAFICRVTRNLAYKRLEFNLALKRNPCSEVSLSELEEYLIDDSFNPNILDEKLDELIHNFLSGEKADVKNVFVRKYWYLESVGDIAARYSFSESKVKSMLYHTRCKLREYLKQEGMHF